MGTLFRLLIIAAIIWFIYSLIRRAISSPQAQDPLPPAPFMPQGRFFCCEAHRDLYLQQKP